MQIPLAYLDITAIEEIDLEVWRVLFDAIGWPPSISSGDELTHEHIVTALQGDEPTAELLLALEAVHTLGTEPGRDAIQRAFDAAGVTADSLPVSAGERELAVHLFLAQRNDPVAADVFARAQVEVEQHGETRRYNEFLGREARPIQDVKRRELQLKEEMLRLCRDQNLGEHVQIRVVEDDRAYLFHVLHSHTLRKPLAVVSGQAGRAVFQFRPVHGDLLRYDAARGRLRIAVRAASLVEHYRRIAGDVLFNDATFFSSDAVCSLRVLREKGARALNEHHMQGVGHVRMTECVWEHGESVLRLRSTDCFQELNALGVPIQDGEFVEAKLKIHIARRSTRPVTVTIRIPGRIEIRGKHSEDLVDAYLEAVGIRTTAPAKPNTGLWSLWPAPHALPAWRAVFGSTTDAMVKSGALAQIRFVAVEHPDFAGAGRVLDVERLDAGEIHGVSRVAEVPSRRLSATDMDALQLMPVEYQAFLRSTFGITGPCAPWSDNGVLDIGTIEVAGIKMHLFYALSEPRPGIGEYVRRFAGLNTEILLLPGAPSKTPEVREVALERAVPSYRSIVRGALGACGLCRSVPAVYTVREHVRLVVDLVFGTVWLDEIAIEGLKPDTHPFRFVVALARASPNPVEASELATLLSAGRIDGNTAARQAKTKVSTAIRGAMKAAGRTWSEDIFPTAGTGCYKCAVVAEVAETPQR